MNLAQRFTVLVKGSIHSAFDALEDPERSLNQLILDMEEQLEAAKRAAAGAMANEDRLRAKIELHEKDTRDWEEAGRRALAQSDEDRARQALHRAELAQRQATSLRERLQAQESDTTQIRESVGRMQEQLTEARSRLQLLQARMRQGEARRAMGKVMQGVERVSVYGELERLSERVELRVAEQNAYFRLEDELSGDDLRRRCESAAVDDAVEQRLAGLRGTPETEPPAGEEQDG